jgi:hypothetical protein
MTPRIARGQGFASFFERNCFTPLASTTLV